MESAKLKRPKKWSIKKSLTISEKKYKLIDIHHFIIRCLGREEEDFEFFIKKGLFNKTGTYGLFIAEKHEIFLAKIQNEIDKHLTILHEIFHVYFRDDKDERGWEWSNDDPVEERCEKSAENMLEWYNNHPKQFSEFKGFVSTIPQGKLTNKDLRGIE